jgi:hypothetical protein
VIDITPQTASFRADGVRRRVDADAPHRGKVDHEAVVADAETAAVMPSAPHGQQQLMLAREGHRGDHVRDIRALRDQLRTLRNHRVEDLAGVIIGGVGRLDEVAAKGGTIGHQVVVREHVDLLAVSMTSSIGARLAANHPQD